MSFRKKFAKSLLLLSFAAMFVMTASCSQTAPQITLSGSRIPAKGQVDVHGVGFTPNGDVMSHLRRPNGTEFPVLPMVTDNRGEFFHNIDTLLLDTGTHELWVV